MKSSVIPVIFIFQSPHVSVCTNISFIARTAVTLNDHRTDILSLSTQEDGIASYHFQSIQLVHQDIVIIFSVKQLAIRKEIVNFFVVEIFLLIYRFFTERLKRNLKFIP